MLAGSITTLTEDDPTSSISWRAFLGEFDDIVDLGLEGEGHPVLLGRLRRRFHHRDQIGQGLGSVVVRVAPPHDFVAAPRAEGHDGRTQCVAGRYQLLQVPQIRPAALLIGIDHVEGPVHRSQGEVALRQLLADLPAEAGAQVLPQDIQAHTQRGLQRDRRHRRAELELDGTDVVAGDGVQGRP